MSVDSKTKEILTAYGALYPKVVTEAKGERFDPLPVLCRSKGKQLQVVCIRTDNCIKKEKVNEEKTQQKKYKGKGEEMCSNFSRDTNAKTDTED